MKPRYFKSQAHFRAWLEQHHATGRELWVGFYKKASGKKGLAYLEAVDAALCFGWIDGIKKRVDDHGFMHRFTPRTKTSSWSVTNTKRVAALIKLGLMAQSGLAVFRARDRKRSGIYLYEQRPQDLSPEYERRFRANARAWTFFQAQPPGYRRLATMWIMTAKKEETRLKRLDTMISASAEEKRTKWI
jgi:uncharacterized protein YdeI (YjbR/CyaY-like superfamily)